MSDVARLWAFFPLGYLLTVAIEVPVLWWGLSNRHSGKTKIVAGLWLTLCTYPIVVLVLPLLLRPRLGEAVYLAVAETFAPLAECILFFIAFDREVSPKDTSLWRDMLAITVANLASFLLGQLLF